MLIMFIRDLFRIQEAGKCEHPYFTSCIFSKNELLDEFDIFQRDPINQINFTPDKPVNAKKTIKSDTLTWHNCILSQSLFQAHTHSQTQTLNTHSLTFVIDHICPPQRLLTWHNILQRATTRSNMPASPGSPNI